MLFSGIIHKVCIPRIQFCYASQLGLVGISYKQHERLLDRNGLFFGR